MSWSYGEAVVAHEATHAAAMREQGANQREPAPTDSNGHTLLAASVSGCGVTADRPRESMP
jgi:hypothetical protein